LVHEFVVGILVSGIFSSTRGLFISSEGGEVVQLSLGKFHGVSVLADSESEGEEFSTEVTDSLVKSGDFVVHSLFEFTIGFLSLSFSFSFNRERGGKVVFDIVEDSHEGVEHTLVSNFFRSFSDQSNDVEDLSITVSDGVFFR
jgi:hypothetical protein